MLLYADQAHLTEIILLGLLKKKQKKKAIFWLLNNLS